MQTETLTIVNIILYLITLVSAFLFRPLVRGLDFYFWLGITITVALFILPFFHANWIVWKKLLMAAIWSIGNVVVWVVCVELANYRIINKLF